MKKFIPFLLLACVTTISSTFCQVWSIHPSAPIIGINILASMAILSFLSKRASLIVFFFQCLLNIILTSAADALKEPVTLTGIVNGIGYACDFGTSLFIYIQKSEAAFFIACLTAQIIIAHKTDWKAKRRKLGLLSLAALVIVHIWGTFSEPLSEFWPNEKVEPGEIVNWKPPERRSLHKRGYLATFILEFGTGYLSRVKQLAPRMDSPVGLEGIPALHAKGKVVFIQVESLDYELLNATSDNEYVMPFLHSMQKTAVVLRLDGTKKLGSANSDFEIFTGSIASSSYIHYTYTKNLPNSLLSKISRKISPSFVFHGMPYFYMNQGPAYTAQGIEHVFCLEEMQRSGVKFLPLWGAGVVADEDIFSFASSKIPADGDFFHFIITMNMHTYDDPSGICPVMRFSIGKDPEFYSLCRTTDSAIQKYVSHLPAGTLVVLWGDHRSYCRDNSGNVPFMAFIKGENNAFDGSRLYGLTRSKMYFYLAQALGLAS